MPRGKANEKLIASLVAKRIVNALKQVQVNEEERAHIVCEAGLLERGVEVFIQKKPVGQPGQGVIKSKTLNSLFRALSNGDVRVG